MCDEVQGVVPLGIGYGGVGVVGNEQLDDVEIPVASGPLHRGSDKVTAEGVDICALLEEVAAYSDVGVDGGPV